MSDSPTTPTLKRETDYMLRRRQPSTTQAADGRGTHDGGRQSQPRTVGRHRPSDTQRQVNLKGASRNCTEVLQPRARHVNTASQAASGKGTHDGGRRSQPRTVGRHRPSDKRRSATLTASYKAAHAKDLRRAGWKRRFPQQTRV